MNRTTLIAFVIVLVLIGAGIVWAMTRTEASPDVNGVATTTDTQTQTGTPTTPGTTTGTPTTNTPNTAGTMITVLLPTPNQTVASPLTVTGQARGNWYFEASFPVELRNAAGTVIAQAPVQAQGDWMTTNFVPFKGTLTFPAQPAGSKGTLVFRKDNPSGLPENDAQIVVPVTF